jgi:tetratricopeptide (TPR) repeat protein
MKNKILLGIIIVVLAMFGILFLKGNNTEISGDNPGKVLTVADYQNKEETLARLGYATEDIEALTGGDVTKEEYVKRLNTILGLLDSAPNEPDMVDATYSVGLYLNLLGESDKAIEQYEYLLTKRTTHSTSLNNLAWIYVERGEYAKAEVNFKKVIEFNPRFASGYINLSDLYRSFIPEKKSGIPKMFEEALKQSTQPIEMKLYLAEYYEAEKEYALAIEWYEKALEDNPGIEYARDAIKFLKPKVSQ